MAFAPPAPILKVGTSHNYKVSFHQSTIIATVTPPKRLARFTRSADFSKPHEIPMEASHRIQELIASGKVNRYLLPATESDASLSEVAIAEKMDFKYCIGVNSCTSAIVLAMKCAGVKHGNKVLTNAFTFTAVPSSIIACGAEPVLVQATKDFHMSVDDLRAKIKAHPDAKVVLLSHFRGRISDCAQIAEICESAGMILIEDCAHCLGVKYKGAPAGRLSQLAAVSVQSDKIINAGEGGYVVTDNPEWAAKLIFMSGGYERRSLSAHLAVPLDHFELLEKAMLTVPNYSYRMTNITGALVLSQLPLLEGRIELWNENGNALQTALSSVIRTGLVEIPQQADGVEGVADHFVFRTPRFRAAQLELFGRLCNEYGVPIRYLGTDDNARFYQNWQYLSEESRAGLEVTATIVRESWDIKLPLGLYKTDMEAVGRLIAQSCLQAAEYEY